MATLSQDYGRTPIRPWLLAGGAVAALALLGWWASTQRLTMTRQSAEQSVLIPLVPPPPPPPPPPEQAKPEPQPEEVPPQPVNQPQPTPQQPTPAQPQAAAPSAGQAVSIDGPAQAGGDGFNIGSGSGGGMRGGGLAGTGGVGGFNRAAYASYLQGELRRAVENAKGLRTAVLSARARLWIDASGRITRAEVSDTDKSDAIRDALLGRSVRPPDPSLSMPVQIRVEFRRNG
ncbi:hypothetical protein [Sphingomonas sp. KR3-1]|uniref:hypothetical protein n=1 Tax=Sphingomonas sp. KR3-1 TaxID=3156611 RepID=UPI0032B5F8EF